MPETKYYISQVKIPNDTKIYNLKDSEAREMLDKLSNATHFLGKTSTALSDGASTATIVIGSDTYAVSPTGAQKQLNNGDIVVASGDAGDSSDEGTEYICAIPGEGSAAITWYKFGSAKLNELGSLAYKNSAGVTGTITATSTYTGAAGDYPVTLSTTAITGATSFKAVDTVGNYDKATKVTYDKATGVSYSKTTEVSYDAVTGVTYDKATTVTYSKATSGTATVNSSATFTGSISAVKTVTPDKNTATSLALSSVATGGTQVVTAIPSTATAIGADVALSTADVYGANSALTVMTGADSLNKTYSNCWTSATAETTAITASVNSEILTFNIGSVSLTPTTASVLSATTGITAGTSSTLVKKTFATGVSSVTQPTISIGNPTKTSYVVAVPANTYVTGVTGTAESINVSVTGSAVTSGAVSITNTATDTTTIDYTATDATVSTSATAASVTNTATAATITSTATDATISYTATATPVTTSTFYGKTTVASASHTHTINATLSAN